MKFEHKIFWKTSIIVMLISSCKKEKIPCTGNCTDITISGIVYDKSLNKLMSNQNIEVSINPSNSCWICSPKIIGKGKSNSSGYFSINTAFDTSLSNNKSIEITATATENYIKYPYCFGQGLIGNNQNTLSQSYYNINASNLNNLRFDFYSKTILKINLHRISNSIQNIYPLFQNYYLNNNTSSSIGIYETANNRDTTVTIYTALNLLTKINTRQQISPTNVNARIDSIICLENNINTINIDY